jgi:hypothetical protein
MNHTKTFEAINKLKDIELELHRLKNALEMANKALDSLCAPQSKQEQGEPVAKQRPFTKQQRDSICMIYDIATGSTTINSFPHIAEIANQLLTEDVYAQPKQEQGEPVTVTHRHEWFRTGEMKVGQMRCISCGAWGQENMPQQRKPLTDEQIEQMWERTGDYDSFAKAIEAAHGIKE